MSQKLEEGREISLLECYLRLLVCLVVLLITACSNNGDVRAQDHVTCYKNGRQQEFAGSNGYKLKWFPLFGFPGSILEDKFMFEFINSQGM